ncbi:MAG TPA: FAD-dependent oxidoreductase [Phycisphaerae bacterium]|nr:FAD-dependent oxidoreductase [Phycisphaerae bacterium]
MNKHLVIVGGVAAGASAAAKARRTDEQIEITLLEAGPYISFANCGLPYYVGGEITNRARLFVTDAERFARRFRVDVRVNTRVTSVDRHRKALTVARSDGAREEMPYDRLVLATGSIGIVPPIRGVDRENVFTLRTVPDADAITAHLARLVSGERETVESDMAAEAPTRALVIGGGYIGLEAAEQLHRRGLKVTLVEMAPQLMLALDPEMAEPLRLALVEAGCDVILRDAVGEIAKENDQTFAITQSGRRLPFNVAVLAVGVRPDVGLAKAAGIALGETGGIQVDECQRTSDPAIYAAGDNCEARHLVLGRPVNIPLAGPATKAGRVAGANAAMDLADVPEDDPTRLRLRGVLGTAVVRVYKTVAAVTGLTEFQARREGIDAEVTYIPGRSHAGYYPGAERMMLKLLYAPDTGRILGAQIVGGEGVDKRADVLATAITAGMTVEDLEQLDLCYAPPFGSARDLVVLGGFVAANTSRGQMPAVTPHELLEHLAGEDAPFLVDDRSAKEYAAGHLGGAINIPIDELRQRMDEVPADRPVIIYCATGYRSYIGQRILMNHGRRNVRNLLGGYRLIQQVQASRKEALD